MHDNAYTPPPMVIYDYGHIHENDYSPPPPCPVPGPLTVLCPAHPFATFAASPSRCTPFSGKVRLLCVPVPPMSWLGKMVCLSRWTFTTEKKKLRSGKAVVGRLARGSTASLSARRSGAVPCVVVSGSQLKRRTRLLPLSHFVSAVHAHNVSHSNFKCSCHLKRGCWCKGTKRSELRDTFVRFVPSYETHSSVFLFFLFPCDPPCNGVLPTAEGNFFALWRSAVLC